MFDGGSGLVVLAVFFFFFLFVLFCYHVYSCVRSVGYFV